MIFAFPSSTSPTLITSCIGMVLINFVGDLAEWCRWLRPGQAIWMVVVGGWVAPWKFERSSLRIRFELLPLDLIDFSSAKMR